MNKKAFVRMELRHLHTFVAAAEQRSFTRAAEELAITQAAVSQHIAALEKDLGVRLFERTSRAVAVTDQGKSFYEYARRILNLVDEARRHVGGSADVIAGSLRLAASTVPAQCLLPELLARFRDFCPEVRESVVVSDSLAAIRAVETGEADLGFVGELPHSSRLSARPIAADELVLVVARSHPLAGKRNITTDQLRSEPIIVRESGSGSRHCVERALQAAGLPPSELNIAMEMNSNEAIRAAVEHGLGIAFLSQSTIDRELTDGRLAAVSVAGVRPQRNLYLITDPDRLPTAAARALIAFAEKHAAGGKRRTGTVARSTPAGSA